LPAAVVLQHAQQYSSKMFNSTKATLAHRPSP